MSNANGDVIDWFVPFSVVAGKVRVRAACC